MKPRLQMSKTKMYPVVCQPGVLQGLSRCVPLGGVEHQQLLDEVFPRVGHVLEVGKVQGVVAGEGLER